MVNSSFSSPRRRSAPRAAGAEAPPPAADAGAPLASRSQPHSVEAEEAVLCGILLGGLDVMSLCVQERILPEAFYSPRAGAIYAAMKAIFDRNEPIEEVILINELTNTGQLEAVGGVSYLAQITNRIRTTVHVLHYIGIVREKHLLRRLIATCTQTVEDCFRLQSGAQDFLERVEQDIFAISEDRPDTTKPIRETIKETVEQMQNLINRSGLPGGLSSGFVDLDRMTFGFHPGDMIVVAARPSMGKTSLALNFAEAAVLPRRPGVAPAHTLVFSLEMTASSLAMRLLASRANVDMHQLREGTLPRKGEALQKITDTAAEFFKAPLKINDSSQLSIGEIRAISRRIDSREKLKFIVIDYLQLIQGNPYTDSREQQIAEISRGVKGLAKELGVPVVVLSQLNRAAEKENRPPRLSDLRESGSIEQDADVVLLLAHPKDKSDDEKQQPVQKVELIIAKQRNGQVGTVPLTFFRSLTRFENHTESHTAAG